MELELPVQRPSDHTEHKGLGSAVVEVEVRVWMVIKGFEAGSVVGFCARVLVRGWWYE